LQWKSNERYTTSVCVFVALCNQHVMRTRGMPRPTIFFYIISETARFLKKILLNTKCLIWFSLQVLP